MLSASSYGHFLQQKNFGPNVIYFALGITEGRPAGAFWADKIVTQGGVLVLRGGGGPGPPGRGARTT